MKWYEIAVEQWHTDAQYRLGRLYAQGNGVPQDYEAALKLFQSAAAKDNSNAENYLGFLHSTGIGVRQDFAEVLVTN